MEETSPLVSNQTAEDKCVGVFLVDGGADYNTNHVTNEFFYGRLFHTNKLDRLIVTSHCPGRSALNPIEHL